MEKPYTACSRVNTYEKSRHLQDGVEDKYFRHTPFSQLGSHNQPTLNDQIIKVYF